MLDFKKEKKKKRKRKWLTGIDVEKKWAKGNIYAQVQTTRGSWIAEVGTGEIGNWGADQYLWWEFGLVAGEAVCEWGIGLFKLRAVDGFRHSAAQGQSDATLW